MPFVLSDKSTFKFKVTVRRPSEAGGWEAFEFLGEFKRLPQPEIDALFSGELPGDQALLERVFVGWSGVKTPEGATLEVNDVNRTALLAEPGVRAALVKAWIEVAVTGPAKN